MQIKDGDILFYTTDTTASTSITWGTVGFTVTRDPCLGNGGNPLVYPHAFLYLTKDMKHEDVQGAITKVKFTIPEDTINKALIKYESYCDLGYNKD